MAWFSKAPLRIGLAGGGTDVSPYCDLYGGAVVNATISLFACATIDSLAEDAIELRATDRNEKQVFGLKTILPIDGSLDLLKAVYNRIWKDHSPTTGGFRLTTSVDAPAGSGLGTSSTLVVAVVGAFVEMLALPFSKDDIAHYAWDIERNDLKFSGGRQDQYAAVFGGFNFMEFFNDGSASVSPLHLSTDTIEAIQEKLVLYYTDSSRNSSMIIDEQVQNVIGEKLTSIEAMHHLKEQATMMKTVLKLGQVDDLGSLLDFGFQHKKNMASNISNPRIEKIYAAAKKAGASGGKISGAGGGGFMVFYCPGNTKNAVIGALASFGGLVTPYKFSNEGLQTWHS